MGEPIKQTPPEVGFKVLGTTLTFNNDASQELRNVTSRLWGAFNKNSPPDKQTHLTH